MKKYILLVFCCFLCGIASRAYSAPWLGLSIPVSMAQNQLDDYNSRWNGYTVGAGLSLDTFIFKWDWMSLLIHAGYSWKDYDLPQSDPPWFVSGGGFMHIDNFRYGFDIRMWPADWLFLSVGQYFSRSNYAEYGDTLFTNEITNTLLGTDTYLRVGTGAYMKINSELQFMLEFYFLHNLTSAYRGFEREFLLAATLRYRLI